MTPPRGDLPEFTPQREGGNDLQSSPRYTSRMGNSAFQCHDARLLSLYARLLSHYARGQGVVGYRTLLDHAKHRILRFHLDEVQSQLHDSLTSA